MAGPGTTGTGLESSHLWLCDENGAVFVLRDLDTYVQSTRAHVDKSDKSPLPPSWSPAGSGFQSLACGFCGTVCGIKKSEICLRSGVTHDNPIGNSWIKTFSKAAYIYVGSRYIVRASPANDLFYTDLSLLDLTKSKSVSVLKWNSLPCCPKELWSNRTEPEHLFMTIDESDRVFCIDYHGNICMYSSLGSTSAKWTRICDAPVLPKSWSLLNMLPFWSESDQQECMFRSTSAGKRTIWCLDSQPKTMEQLVLSNVNHQGEVVLRTTWSKCELPIDDEVLFFCADKCRSGAVLVGALSQEDGDTLLLYCSLGQSMDTTERVLEIPLATTCRSVSICKTSVPSAEAVGNNSLSQEEFKSLELNRSDTCCENGDCSFCRRASRQPPLLGDVPLIIGIKRARSDTSEVPPPKRPYIAHTRHALLNGVKLQVKPTLHIHKIAHPSKLVVPFSHDQIDNKFDYSFKFANQVITEKQYYSTS